MSPWTYCPTVQCSPGHSAIVQTDPLSAKCPPMLIVLGRVYKGAMERTGQFEAIHCLVSRLLLSLSHVTEGITISMQYAEGKGLET